MRKIYIILFILFFFAVAKGGDFIDRDSQRIIIKKSYAILKLLQKPDFKRLSVYVNKDKGLRFSPYDQEKLTKVKSTKYPNNVPNISGFRKDQLAKFMNDNATYTWGNYAGSGFHIKLSPRKYYKEFIYDFDYLNKAKAIYIKNDKSQKAKTVKYIFKAYPESEIVQYYYKGAPETEYNDFKKLSLVFENIDDQWFLVGIVHGERM